MAHIITKQMILLLCFGLGSIINKDNNSNFLLNKHFFFVLNQNITSIVWTMANTRHPFERIFPRSFAFLFWFGFSIVKRHTNASKIIPKIPGIRNVKFSRRRFSSLSKMKIIKKIRLANNFFLFRYLFFSFSFTF